MPAALEKPLRAELDRLVGLGVLSPVTEDEPTDWVNSLVCTTKSNGSLRLCLDPKDLNKAIKRPHHATRTLENILPRINGAKYISILDALSGYWNIKLSRQSSYLTTFNTPHGRFRFNRLPFGLICAQDVFQHKVDEAFGDLPGVTGIADDILVVGYKEDGSDHDENIRAVLERARKCGIRFNPEKLKVRCKRISFFGNVLSASGLEPDPAKVQAIKYMNAPSDAKELLTFLGLATYLSRFTPRLSELAAPLRELCKKDSQFTWGHNEQHAFEELKDALTSPTVLKYFDDQKPVTIQVDASQRGLGAALLQDQGPIEYASKTLTDAETRYSNIEREMLGVVFGLERFHYYAYGRKVKIETDHKPLEAIFKKYVNKAPPRIARMMLRIQKYDVEIIYVPGKDISLADALSRVNPCEGEEVKGLNITVHEIHSLINASPTRRRQIQEETAKDSVLSSLAKVIHQGWPVSRSLCPPLLLDFWNYRDELSIEDGIILKGTRIMIPKSLIKDALEQIHFAHQGIEKCKLRAKTAVFWHGINQDIEAEVKHCAKCQANKPAQSKEPLLPHDVPPRAWHTLGSDIFYKNNSSYLLVVDYYSKFPVIKKLSSTTANAVVNQFKAIFSEHGIPEKVISDNGPQYSATEFVEFSEQYGFTHVTSSPMYARSNGQAERTVKTVKDIWEKSNDPYMALLILRTTPIDHHIPAPCVLLNKRMYKNNLPFTRATLMLDQNINNMLQERQDIQKAYHDRGAKELKPLTQGESIRMYDFKGQQWRPAEVIEKVDTPRSYRVKCENGGVYRRNRRHLRSTLERNIMKPLETDGDTEEDTPECSPNNNTLEQTPQPTPRTSETAVQPRRSTRVRTSTDKHYRDYVK